MTWPLVSCLVAAYDYEQYLPLALESALAQDYPADRLEVIVVDDGSNDRTGEIAEEYAARHPAQIRAIRKENGGWVSAMNRAVAEARGELLAVLDADDVWLPQKLRRSAEIFVARSEVSLVYSDMQVVDGNGALTHPSFLAMNGLVPLTGHVAGALAVRNTVTASSIVLRASLRDAFHPIPAEATYGDWWLAFGAATAGDLACVPEALVQYRIHGANLTAAVAGAARLREFRKELALRRYLLVEFASLLTPEELVDALALFERTVQIALTAGPTTMEELVPVDAAHRLRSLAWVAAAEAARARGDDAEGIRSIARAAALDPWSPEVARAA